MHFSKLFRTNLLISIILFIGFGLVGVTFFYEFWYDAKTRIENKASMEMTKLYSEIAPEFTRLVSLSSSIANDGFLISCLSDIKNYGTPKFEKDIVQYLDGIRKLYNSDAAFLSTVADKKLYSQKGFNRILGNDTASAWYDEALLKEHSYSINLDTDKFSKNEQSIFVNYKVYDRKDNLIAIAGLAIHTDRITKYLKDFKEMTGSNAFFIMDNGETAICTDMNKHRLWEQISQEPEIKKIIRDCQYDKFERLIINQDYKRYINIKYVSDLGWFLVIDYPIENVIDTIENGLYKTTAIFCISLLITIFIVTRIVRDFENRIITLAVTEIFDALVTNKPYKKGFFLENAFDIISEKKKPKFNSNIIESFLKASKNLKEDKE